MVLKSVARKESRNAEMRVIVCLLMASLYLRTDFKFARKMVLSASHTVDECQPYLDMLRPIVTAFLEETGRKLSLPTDPR
jgi:hypothetical protein